MSVACRFRTDVAADFDPSLVDALVKAREDALAIQEELRGPTSSDASKDATAA